jgi:transcriptional regulator with XRE-family HTH domain
LKTPFPPPNDILVEILVEARTVARLTQNDLAARLSIGQSTVSKVERGVQHLTMVELHRWLTALEGPTLSEVAREFQERLEARTSAERRWRRLKPPMLSVKRPTRSPKRAR